MINLTINKILIPVDFSGTALQAIKHGAFMAQLTKGELILLHVQKRNDLLNIILPAIKVKNGKKVIMEFLTGKLKKLAEETSKKYRVTATPVVSIGNITSEIIRVAKEYKVGTVVMGTRGSDSNNDVFLGSNAYRLLTKSDIPVMTVRTDTTTPGYSSILLPIDTSTHSRQKVNMAIEFARKFGSHIHVLGILGKNEDAHEYKLKVILPQIQKMAKARKLECTAEIVKAGNRAKETLACAKKIKADLIICMRDETTEFSGLILGTYAHQLLNSSIIPLLCIPPEVHPENIEPDNIGGMW